VKSDNKRLSRRMLYAMLRGSLAGLLLGGIFLAGFIVRGVTTKEPNQIAQAQAPQTFPILNEINGLVYANFYKDPPEDRTMEYAAIRGYLGALNDPYSFFNDPPVAQSESDALAGVYGGIGVVVKRNVQGFIELYPYPDSPALRIGIVDGDVLLAVNGQHLDINERIDVIQQMLRGEVKEGNGVEITVRHVTSDTEATFWIPFEEILVPSVLWRILPGEPVLGYVHITSFTARTPEELTTAITELRNQAMVGLILDLRDNFGGLLQESIQVAGEFLDGGIVLIEQSRAGETITEDTPGGIATAIPLIVITNYNSASASEVVAAALQQNGRALILGQATHGKGSVQLIFRLSDNSSFRITGAIWLTPDRSPLDGIGLKPDIEMIPDENGRDVELDEAIRQLGESIREPAQN
jgi:carboxyl-terminal processing protease